jgi:hypothetical protein
MAGWEDGGWGRGEDSEEEKSDQIIGFKVLAKCWQGWVMGMGSQN